MTHVRVFDLVVEVGGERELIDEGMLVGGDVGAPLNEGRVDIEATVGDVAEDAVEGLVLLHDEDDMLNRGVVTRIDRHREEVVAFEGEGGQGAEVVGDDLRSGCRDVEAVQRHEADAAVQGLLGGAAKVGATTEALALGDNQRPSVGRHCAARGVPGAGHRANEGEVGGGQHRNSVVDASGHIQTAAIGRQFDIIHVAPKQRGALAGENIRLYDANALAHRPVRDLNLDKFIRAGDRDPELAAVGGGLHAHGAATHLHRLANLARHGVDHLDVGSDVR